MKKKIIYTIIILIIIIQFFRIDKTNPEIIVSNDFIEVSQPSEEIKVILKSACYDCHSNETKYPWYSNIAPVSWLLKDHINEGREELNFSEWGTFTAKRKDHKLEEIVEMLEKGEMPLKGYTLAHQEAQLTNDQKTLLMDWIKAIRTEAKAAKNKKILHLNNGKKWAANPETTIGIKRMTEIIQADVADGRISFYVAMGEKLNMQLDSIFKQCTMTGEEHDQLHLFLTPLIADCDNLINAEDEQSAMLLQKDILKQLNKYHLFFE